MEPPYNDSYGFCLRKEKGPFHERLANERRNETSRFAVGDESELAFFSKVSLNFPEATDAVRVDSASDTVLSYALLLFDDKEKMTALASSSHIP